MTISEAIKVIESHGMKVDFDNYDKDVYIVHLLTKTLNGKATTMRCGPKDLLLRAERIGYEGGYFPFSKDRR